MSSKTKTYKYIFSDGYICYTFGKMSNLELKHETIKHGKLTHMEVTNQ